MVTLGVVQRVREIQNLRQKRISEGLGPDSHQFTVLIRKNEMQRRSLLPMFCKPG